MAIAFVQSASSAGTSQAYGSNVTLGNLLLVVAGSQDIAGAITFAISDTQGNAWTALGVVDANSVNGGRGQLFYAVAKATGANTVTLTTGSTTPLLAVHEFSGATFLDVQASAIGSGTSPDSGPVTTGAAAELLFGFNVNVPTSITGLSAGVGWTQAEAITQKLITEYQIVAATGTFDATSAMTTGKSPTNLWLAEIATFSVTQVSKGHNLMMMGIGA